MQDITGQDIGGYLFVESLENDNLLLDYLHEEGVISEETIALLLSFIREREWQCFFELTQGLSRAELQEYARHIQKSSCAMAEIESGFLIDPFRSYWDQFKALAEFQCLPDSQIKSIFWVFQMLSRKPN